jgi:hypothetical protein
VPARAWELLNLQRVGQLACFDRLTLDETAII